MPFSKYRTDYFVSILSDADKSRVAPSCGIMYVPPVLSHEPAMVVTDGVCVVEDGNTDHPKGSDSMAASSSCTQYASAFSASPSPENDDHSMNSATSVSGDLEQSQAMRLLDAELVELERLILLQRRKVEGLGRLREQYLSGDRVLPDAALGCRPADMGGGNDASCVDKGVLEDNPPALGRNDRFDMLPTVGQFEHYTVPYASIPSANSPLVAVKVLGFRLKGGGSGKSRTSGGYSQRPSSGTSGGHLIIIASLHANGMIHLYDVTGEEILEYDSGHGPATFTSGGATLTASAAATPAYSINTSPTAAAAVGGAEQIAAQRPPIVVDFSGDASENDPVLVTVGANGTVRVHALAVTLRGKRIAGRRRSSRRKSPKSEGSDSGTTAATSDGVDGGGTKDEPRLDSSEDGGGRTERGEQSESTSPRASPKTRVGVGVGVGVGVTVQFRVCFGGSCPENVDSPVSEGRASMGTDDLEKSKRRESSSRGDMDKIVTSVSAFFHRALERTVVIAGYSTGGVNFFDGKNGTVLGSAGGSNAVAAVVRSGQSIAYSDGQDVRFASATKLQAIPDRVCRGGWGTRTRAGRGGARITALAFDTLSPATLYAGSEAGDVLRFNSRKPEADGSHPCLPAYQLPSPQQQPQGLVGEYKVHEREGSEACNALSTVRGYLLVSHGSRLSVFNTTEDTQLLFTKDNAAPAVANLGNDIENEGCGEGGVELVPRWSVSSSYVGGDAFVVEAKSCAAGLTVHKAHLPYDRQKTDLSWLRVPILIFGLVIVAVTQVYTKRPWKSKSSARSRKSRKGWTEANDDDDDSYDEYDVDGRDVGELNSQISRLHEAVNPIIRGSSGGSSGRGGALEQEGRSRTGERWEGVKGMSTINPVRYGDKWGMADDEGSSSG